MMKLLLSLLLATLAGHASGYDAVVFAGPDRLLAGGSVFIPGPDVTELALARYSATTPVELSGFSIE